jgi:hypothetical protein
MGNLNLSAISRVALVRAKTERAKQHLRSLEDQLLAYRNKTQPIVDEGRRLELITRYPVLSFEILTTAGDVVHNLRTALDHLAHQLVLVGNPSVTPSRKIEFPILGSKQEYLKKKAGKTQGMREDALRAIDELKPYKEGNPALWRLRELDNIDKHRMILSVGESCLLEAEWIGWAPYLMKARDPHFKAALDSPEVDLRSSELLGDPAIIGRETLYPTLRELVLCVDHIVEDFRPCLEPTQMPSATSNARIDFRQLG